MPICYQLTCLKDSMRVVNLSYTLHTYVLGPAGASMERSSVLHFAQAPRRSVSLTHLAVMEHEKALKSVMMVIRYRVMGVLRIAQRLKEDMSAIMKRDNETRASRPVATGSSISLKLATMRTTSISTDVAQIASSP